MFLTLRKLFDKLVYAKQPLIHDSRFQKYIGNVSYYELCHRKRVSFKIYRKVWSDLQPKR